MGLSDRLKRAVAGSAADDAAAAAADAPDEAQALMLAFQRGDDRAFDRLVEMCQRELFALGYRYGLTADEADDLAQEVFIKVYKARAAYRPEARFRSWLIRIATNAIISDARKRKLRKATSLSALKAKESDEVEVADARAEAPWARLGEEERRALLERALASLPDSQRVALVMNRFHEQSYEEVGQALGLKVPAVKSLLYRARQSLKAALEPHLGEEG